MLNHDTRNFFDPSSFARDYRMLFRFRILRQYVAAGQLHLKGRAKIGDPV